MFALRILLVLSLLLLPTVAHANDWCEVHPDSPECGNLNEPVVPIIGTPCSSDFEWSCYSKQLYLPLVSS